MEFENILTVIDELGSLLKKHQTEIKLKDYEIERLNKKIRSIESHIDFYAEQTITTEDYKKAIKGA